MLPGGFLQRIFSHIHSIINPIFLDYFAKNLRLCFMTSYHLANIFCFVFEGSVLYLGFLISSSPLTEEWRLSFLTLGPLG